MYDFIKIQWMLRKFREANIANCVTKGYITQEQADTILAMPQIQA